MSQTQFNNKLNNTLILCDPSTLPPTVQNSFQVYEKIRSLSMLNATWYTK